MAFKCPQCHRSRTLKIVRRLELPPDSRSDEITLQIIRCSDCSFAGLAVYQESRRGSLDHEHFDHTGYHVPAAVLQEIRTLILQCPNPKDPRCTCPTHQQLGRKNDYGRWVGPNSLTDAHTSFPIER